MGAARSREPDEDRVPVPLPAALVVKKPASAFSTVASLMPMPVSATRKRTKPSGAGSAASVSTPPAPSIASSALAAEVEQHLLEASRVGDRREVGRAADVDRDGRLDAVPEEPRRRLDRVATGHGDRGRGRRARERRSGRPRGAGGGRTPRVRRSTADRRSEPASPCGARERRRAHLVEQRGSLVERGAERGDRVADVVGDARRHRADRREPVRRREARAGLGRAPPRCARGRACGPRRGPRAPRAPTSAFARRRPCSRPDSASWLMNSGDDEEERELGEHREAEQRRRIGAPERDGREDRADDERVERRARRRPGPPPPSGRA